MTEDRLQIWNEYKGYPHKIVRRMFVDYDRYYEASQIAECLRNIGVDITKLRVLDFGCGAGDYGMHLARLGAKVNCWDFPRATDFVAYRIQREGLRNIKAISADDNILTYNYDLIIYGEVLEHLDNPLEELTTATKTAKYIFTSSYPFRSDDPSDSYWSNGDHRDEARLLQPACRKILESFKDHRLGGEMRLWAK